MSLHDFRHDMLHRGHVRAQIAECAHISSDREVYIIFAISQIFLVLFRTRAMRTLIPYLFFCPLCNFCFFRLVLLMLPCVLVIFVFVRSLRSIRQESASSALVQQFQYFLQGKTMSLTSESFFSGNQG